MSYFARLNEDEQQVVKLAMEAMFDYFDRDFHAQMGVTDGEMRQTILEWPEIDDLDDDSPASIAINNSLYVMLNGSDTGKNDCQQKLHIPRAELARIYTKWASLRGWDSTGAR